MCPRRMVSSAWLLASIFAASCASKGSTESPVESSSGLADTQQQMDVPGDMLDADDTDGSAAVDAGSADARSDDSQPVGPCAGKDDGAPCEDGNVCTVNDSCVGGQCTGGQSLICDEKGVCQPGTCDPEVGCVYEALADGTPCSVSCFSLATCQEGVCAPDEATATPCPKPEDPNGCIDSLVCEPATGLCTKAIYKPDGAACDSDEDLCTLETCQNAVCTSMGEVNECEAEVQNNPCWTYTCTKKDGICKATVFVTEASCTDNNPCTMGDQCDEVTKTCVGQPIPVDDANPCTDDYCDAGAIFHDVIEGATCPATSSCSTIGTCSASGQCEPADCGCVDADECAAPTTPCGVVSCDGGICVPGLLPEGSPCDDGDDATASTACDAQGNCVADAPPGGTVFAEDFDDGDYEVAPAGVKKESCNPGNCGTMTLTVATPTDGDSPVLSVKRIDAPSDSGALMARYEALNTAIPDGAALTLRYDVRILQDGLTWGGNGCNEWTARVGVVLVHVDGSVSQVNSVHNTGSKGCTSPDTKVWIYETLSPGDWTSVVIDLTDALAGAISASPIASLKLVEVGSNGWNFEAEFDNVRIEATP